jgi:hypothetical protein
MANLSDPVLDGTVCGVHSGDYGERFHKQNNPVIISTA